MDRIRDIIGPIDRFSAIGENGRTLTITADVLPRVDPAWLSMGQMARDVVASPALTAALGSGAASGTLARLFAQPGWTESVLGTQALRLRVMDFSAHIEAVIPKFEGLVVLPEIGRSLALASEAWALVAHVMPEAPDSLSTSRLLEAGRTTLGVSMLRRGSS